jgi:hypothetical protein
MATKEKASKTSEISSGPSERALDEHAIRSRAYEISQSEVAGTPEENNRRTRTSRHRRRRVTTFDLDCR